MRLRILIYILFLTFSFSSVASLSAQKKTSTARRTTTTAKKSTGKSTAAKTTTKKSTKTTTKKSSKTTSSKGKQTTTTVTNSAIKGLRQEQAEIKQNIRKHEQALKANKAEVTKKMKDLERISSDIDRRQRSIDSIQHDISSITEDISMLSMQLDNLEAMLAERKRSYMKSLRYMARHHSIGSKVMFVFSSENFAQAYRRMRFMKDYATWQRTQGEALEEQRQRVEEKRGQLNDAKHHKNVLLNKDAKEKQALSVQKQQEQKLVASLKDKQKTIQSVIDDQKKRDAVLNSRIDALIAEEIERARQRAIAEAKKKAAEEARRKAEAKRKAEELARKKAEAEARARENARRIAEAKAAEEKAKAAAAQAARDEASRRRAEQLAREAESQRIAAERKAVVDAERDKRTVAEATKKSEDAVVMLTTEDRVISGGFEANRGRLPSPVVGGRVVSHFGQHGVEGLPGVVLDNKGINILGGPGASACSIYDGEVSAVFNVGSSMGVLIRHGAYISVYCNLASVSVSRGQKVSTRQPIGKIGKDNILQFQLRKERTKLNPEQWLAR